MASTPNRAAEFSTIHIPNDNQIQVNYPALKGGACERKF
jgi:hypothetical protein